MQHHLPANHRITASHLGRGASAPVTDALVAVRGRGALIRGADGPLMVYRSGMGAPVLLVHGITGSALQWHPILPALARRCEVIAVDARGHGRSGAARAGRQSVRPRSRPPTVGAAAPWPAMEGSARDAAQPSRAPTYAIAAEELLADRRRLSLAVLEWLVEREHWSRFVPDLSAPTLLLTADVDRGAIVSPLVARQVVARNVMARTTCHVRVRHVAGAGHGIHDQRPGEFLAAVLPFLAAHAKR